MTDKDKVSYGRPLKSQSLSRRAREWRRMPYLYRSFSAKEPYNSPPSSSTTETWNWRYDNLNATGYINWFTSVDIFIYTHTYICIYIYICMYIYICIYIHTDIHIYVCVCVSIYINMYTNMYTYIHIYIHTYMYTWNVCIHTYICYIPLCHHWLKILKRYMYTCIHIYIHTYMYTWNVCIYTYICYIPLWHHWLKILKRQCPSHSNYTSL